MNTRERSSEVPEYILENRSKFLIKIFHPGTIIPTVFDKLQSYFKIKEILKIEQRSIQIVSCQIIVILCPLKNVSDTLWSYSVKTFDSDFKFSTDFHTEFKWMKCLFEHYLSKRLVKLKVKLIFELFSIIWKNIMRPLNHDRSTKRYKFFLAPQG